jgi:hypothetical protein
MTIARTAKMNAPLDPRETEAEVFRAFGLACRAERDRISLAGLAEQDRRFERSSVDRATAERFAAHLIASFARR